MAIRLVDLALLTIAGHQGAKLALNTLEADFDRMIRGLDPRFHRPRRKRDHQSAAVERQRVESSCASSSRRLADNLGAAVTLFDTMPPAIPQGAAPAPRVRSSLPGDAEAWPTLPACLPAADQAPFSAWAGPECSCCGTDRVPRRNRRQRDHNRQSRQGSRAPPPSWRCLPLRQKFPEPRAARADIHITAHRSEGALSDRTAPICRQGPN
jgi:hypothetical protein